MKKIKIIYWISTGIFAALMILSAIPDAMVVPDAIKVVNVQLHYPVYIISFLGIAKILGAIAVLIPGFPRIKEWAYAGLAFDLIGATYSEIAVGSPAMGPQGGWILMLIWFIPLVVSYIYYHKKIRIA